MWALDLMPVVWQTPATGQNTETSASVFTAQVIHYSHNILLVLNTANIICKAEKIINYIVHGEKFYQELLPTEAQLPVV